MLKKIVFWFKTVGIIIGGLIALLGIRAMANSLYCLGKLSILSETIILVFMCVGALALLGNQYLKEKNEKE